MVWSGQADFVQFGPKEVATVITSASVGGTGSKVGDSHQDVAAGGKCWQ